MLAHLELEDCLRQRIQEQEGEAVLQDFDLPLIPVLAEMELRGVRIDLEELNRQSQKLSEDIKRLEQGNHKEAGRDLQYRQSQTTGPYLVRAAQSSSEQENKNRLLHG